jgi:hypothetical protein
MSNNVPCAECPTYVMCKARENICKSFKNARLKMQKEMRFGDSVTELAFREDCPYLIRYLDHADQDEVNKARILFGMEPYKFGYIKERI